MHEDELPASKYPTTDAVQELLEQHEHLQSPEDDVGVRAQVARVRVPDELQVVVPDTVYPALHVG